MAQKSSSSRISRACCKIRLRLLAPIAGRLRCTASPEDADVGLVLYWQSPGSDRCPSRRADSNVILLGVLRVGESGLVMSVMLKLYVFY